jgi:predicted regulator of Ras-like GTPase activity (Roadblock/LC7/MglB family)
MLQEGWRKVARPTMIVLEADHSRFVSILDKLRSEANSKFVFLMDKNGQSIASSGALSETDPTALASLAAGNVAATEGLAELIGENEFSTLFHEGRSESLHISLISNKVILLVIFDEHSSLGLVRLRVEQRRLPFHPPPWPKLPMRISTPCSGKMQQQ